MGKRKSRPHTAGAKLNLDKCPVELLSRPASRNVVTREWLARMRNKGVLISEAELKYRHWLGLSESSRPLTPSEYKSKTELPHGDGQIKHTRASMLRIDHLPEPQDRVNYTAIARELRQFDKKCRKATPTPILTEQFPANETYNEFISGARYNSTHHIDSRSLERLGVYIPRRNIAGTFINPAGIIPHSKHRSKQGSRPESRGMLNQVDTTQVPSIFEIKDCIEKYELSPAFSSSSLGNSTLVGSMTDFNTDSNKLKTDLCHETHFTAAARDSSSAFSITKESTPAIAKTESKSTNSLDKPQKALNDTPATMVLQTEEEDLSQDDQKLSAEAQQLAHDIIQQSMHSLDSNVSSDGHDYMPTTRQASLNQTDGENLDLKADITDEMNLADEQLVAAANNTTLSKHDQEPIIAKTRSEVSISNKSTSAIVVDMTQLHINQ